MWEICPRFDYKLGSLTGNLSESNQQCEMVQTSSIQTKGVINLCHFCPCLYYKTVTFYSHSRLGWALESVRPPQPRLRTAAQQIIKASSGTLRDSRSDLKALFKYKHGLLVCKKAQLSCSDGGFFPSQHTDPLLIDATELGSTRCQEQQSKRVFCP